MLSPDSFVANPPTGLGIQSPSVSRCKAKLAELLQCLGGELKRKKGTEGLMFNPSVPFYYPSFTAPTLSAVTAAQGR